jgi:hypothetical protein
MGYKFRELGLILLCHRYKQNDLQSDVAKSYCECVEDFAIDDIQLRRWGPMLLSFSIMNHPPPSLKVSASSITRQYRCREQLKIIIPIQHCNGNKPTIMV